MYHSQSYPVTNLPQPHLSYGSRSSTNNSFCSGWCAFVVAGVFAFVFLVCLYLYGGQKLFLVAIDPSADLVPIIKEGFLRVHPFLQSSDIGIESLYFCHLPPRNLSQVTALLDQLFLAYPASHEGSRYRNCWLENPSAETPCFFDATWLAEVCTSHHSYGYEESDGHYSPCLVIRLEQTGNWTPRFTHHVPKATADHSDPGFSPVHCYVQGERGQPNITVYPPKGFSHQFFPVSRFHQEKYLLPMVAVKLHRIPRGRNLTVECSVVTPSAFLLWNNGKAVVRFQAA